MSDATSNGSEDRPGWPTVRSHKYDKEQHKADCGSNADHMGKRSNSDLALSTVLCSLVAPQTVSAAGADMRELILSEYKAIRQIAVPVDKNDMKRRQ